MTMDHAATVRRIYELINGGDLEGFGRHMADDFVDHEELPGLAPTKDGVLAFFRMQRAAFPDMRMDVRTSWRAATRSSPACGTRDQPREFMGTPATGKSVDVQLVDIFRFGDDGLAHEHWGVMDQLTMMQQLGLVPAGPPA